MDKIRKKTWQDNTHYVAQALCVTLAFMIPVSTALTTVCMLLILLIWGISGHFKHKMQVYLKHPLSGSIWLLIGLSGLGLLYTHSIVDASSTMTDYLRLAYIPVLMFYLRDKAIQRYVVQAFIAAMILTLVLGYLKVYAHVPIGLKYTMGAVFKNHIKTSYLMAMAAFILSVYGYQNPQHRWWVGGMVLAMFYYLFFMSFGRIGHLTVLLLVLLWGWHLGRLKGLLAMVAALAAILMTIYTTSDVFADRINVLQKDWTSYHEGGKAVASSSMGSRAMFYKVSTHIFLERPLIGVGTGGFERAYSDYVGKDAALLTDNPHNQYLKIMVESGVLGALVLFFFFYQTWHLSLQTEKKQRFLIQGILLSFYTGCLLNSWLCDFVESYFYILFCATAFASIAIQETQPIEKAKPLLGVLNE